MKQLMEKHRQLVRYLIFGVLTTAVNLGTYGVLRAALPGLPKTPLSTAATLVSILFAYLTNRRWVFQSRARGPRAVLLEALHFFGARALTLLLEAGMVLAAVDLMGWNDWLVKATATVLVIALNYLFSRFWIFRPRPGD